MRRCLQPIATERPWRKVPRYASEWSEWLNLADKVYHRPLSYLFQPPKTSLYALHTILSVSSHRGKTCPYRPNGYAYGSLFTLEVSQASPHPGNSTNSRKWIAQLDFLGSHGHMRAVRPVCSKFACSRASVMMAVESLAATYRAQDLRKGEQIRRSPRPAGCRLC